MAVDDESSDEALEGELVDPSQEEDSYESDSDDESDSDHGDSDDGDSEDSDSDGDSDDSDSDDSDSDEALEARLAQEQDALEGEIVDDAALVREILPRAKSKGGSADITKLDPLQAYMRDVLRYSLLTADETKDLAVRYQEQGDVVAARKLVTSNLRLVVKIAFDYRRAYRNILDLIQEGNIGLMQAVKKYDPYRGVKLSSYAAWWIRAYILRFILNNWRLVKVGTTQAQRKLFFNLKKEKARLSAMGIEPTHELIAERLSVPVREVVNMDRRLSTGELSLDAPIGRGDDEGKSTSRIETMPALGRGADEELAKHELDELLTDKIHEFGATLEGKEAVIFTERLVAEDPKTLQELGTRFGVSRERVRQIEKRLQGKIRRYLEEQVEASALPS